MISTSTKQTLISRIFARSENHRATTCSPCCGTLRSRETGPQVRRQPSAHLTRRQNKIHMSARFLSASKSNNKPLNMYTSNEQGILLPGLGKVASAVFNCGDHRIRITVKHHDIEQRHFLMVAPSPNMSSPRFLRFRFPNGVYMYFPQSWYIAL